MFGHKRIPSREGGIEIVVTELSSRMAALGHQVTCYNRSGHHVSGEEYDTEHQTEFQGVTIRRVPTIDRKGIAAATSSFFATLFTAFGRYDVVHIHAEGPAVFCWLPRLLGKKVVCTIHGLDYQRSKWSRFASWYILLGEKSAVRFANEIIVLSRDMQDYFMQTYHRETVYIPNGITRPTVYPAQQITQQFGLTKDSYILFLGRIVPEKGIHYLIEAYKRLDTDKRLVIAGSTSDTDQYVQELKELSAGDDRVIYTGFVEGRILDELYSNAYIYCLPSDLEGMPLSLLEAMSYGCCCLTSDIAECTEVVGDHAAVFAKGDVADLQRQLGMLCADASLVDGYKDAAADYICGKYSWDDVVRQTLALYQ